MKSIFDEHLKHVKSFGGSLTSYIADLDQCKGYGPAAGPHIPTLVTHGTLHEFVVHKRHAVGKEHLVFQGVPAYPELATCMGLKQLPWQAVLDSASSQQLRRVAPSLDDLPRRVHLVAVVPPHGHPQRPAVHGEGGQQGVRRRH